MYLTNDQIAEMLSHPELVDARINGFALELRYTDSGSMWLHCGDVVDIDVALRLVEQQQRYTQAHNGSWVACKGV